MANGDLDFFSGGIDLEAGIGVCKIYQLCVGF
jgi:hypothetical protein